MSMGLGILNALLQDLLRLFDELAMQIDRVRRYAAIGVVLTENVLGRLLVVLLHLAAVGLSLLRKLFGAGAISA